MNFTFTLPNSGPVQPNGPSVYTSQIGPYSVPGNYVATVTVDTSNAADEFANFNVRLPGGENVNISAGQNWINSSFNSGPPDISLSQGTPVTLQFIGTEGPAGDTVTALYDIGSGFTVLGSLTDPEVSGSSQFSMGTGMYGDNSGWSTSSTSYSNFSVVQSSVPDGGMTFTMLGGALASLAALRRRFAK